MTLRAVPKKKAKAADRYKVLFICHNHPSVRPGGAEAYALELHRYLRESEHFEPTFLAKGGPPLSPAGQPHLGTCTALVGDAPDEYFFYMDGYGYDWVFGTIPHDKELYTKHFRSFLRGVQPDIVHLQHTMFFGYDVLREIRNTLPSASIVYTLHEFMPICHRQGQMLRTTDDQACMEESPRRCHECFPEISPQTFFLRKRFVQSHFELVDLFLAPSEFLRQRYIDWGIPPERIRTEEYGRTLAAPIAESAGEREVRDRFAYFGQLTPYKGVHVVLEAVARLLGKGVEQDDPLIRALESAATGTLGEAAGSAQPQVSVYGANLDLQPGEYQNKLRELFERTSESVTLVGRYDHAQLPRLMAEVDWVIVPSIWWENSPLVIQEAFNYGRPVICSDIGGMAEKVSDGVNGLHFKAGDAASLAAVIQTALETPGLLDRLRRGIEPVYSMSDHVAALGELYAELLDRKEMAGVG
jgi:glycosyltransferase involved in cell wall biosynthesis